jgi:hypothetical protein
MTLNLGEDIPVLSTVFGSAVPGGFASVPQSSFNYRAVGVNLSITPRVTFDGEIVLDLTVQSSTLGPSISVAGQDVPSFGNRQVKTRLRLREGESNLLAGLLKDDQRKILTGFPGVMKLPILRSLFGQTTDEISQTDIVFLLTPHIVRTHELTLGSGADLHRHAVERRSRRTAAAHRATAGSRGAACCAGGAGDILDSRRAATRCCQAAGRLGAWCSPSESAGSAGHVSGADVGHAAARTCDTAAGRDDSAGCDDAASDDGATCDATAGCDRCARNPANDTGHSWHRTGAPVGWRDRVQNRRRSVHGAAVSEQRVTPVGDDAHDYL